MDNTSFVKRILNDLISFIIDAKSDCRKEYREITHNIAVCYDKVVEIGLDSCSHRLCLSCFNGLVERVNLYFIIFNYIESAFLSCLS